MKKTSRFALALALFAPAALLTGCGDDDPIEDAADEVEDAADDVGDEIEDLGD